MSNEIRAQSDSALAKIRIGWGAHPNLIRIGGFFGCGEMGELGESEILKIPILTKPRQPRLHPIPSRPLRLRAFALNLAVVAARAS